MSFQDIPFTYKEQHLIMEIANKSSITFKDQSIFKDRHSFCKAILRLTQRFPRIIKARKQYLNKAKTTYKMIYSLTFDGRFLAKTYLLPNAINNTENSGDIDA